MDGGEYLSPPSRSKQQGLLGLSPQKSPCQETGSRRTQSQGADDGEMSVMFAFYPCSVRGAGGDFGHPVGFLARAE